MVRGLRTRVVWPRYFRIQSALKGSRSSGVAFAWAPVVVRMDEGSGRIDLK